MRVKIIVEHTSVDMYNDIMRSYKLIKERAIALRKAGKSYSEILKLLGIKSKGTLSLWFKDLELSVESMNLLKENLQLAHERGLFYANANRKAKIGSENEIARNDGIELIDDLSLRDILLIGTALYWAEGMKSERTQPSLSFSNSDPSLIAVYMRFVREVLKIPEDRIRAGVHIYPSISADGARNYWSSITKLPQNRFYIITQVSSASKGRRPKNLLKFGTAVIKVNNRVQFHKVKGMIEGIVRKAIKK